MRMFDLALKELRFEWRAAMCLVAAIVAILTPMLLLLALKNGLVDGLVEDLVEDPRNREVLSTRVEVLDQGFFEAWAARDDIAFVSPRTRSINTQAEAVRNTRNRDVAPRVTLIPTAPGDPLLPPDPVARSEAYISSRMAQQLAWLEGDTITLIIRRDVDGMLQTASHDFTVKGVLPETASRQTLMFLSLEDLWAVERFLDDRSILPERWMEDILLPDRFASFRMYTRELNDLRAVLDDLEATGIAARPRTENAVVLVDFQQRLNWLYVGIALIAAIGFWSSMAANLRGMVERQRVSISLLALVGATPRDLAALPAVQSLALAWMGIALSLLLVLPGTWIANALLSTQLRDIAYLTIDDITMIVGLGTVLSASASVWAVGATSRIGSDEVLRSV